MTDPTPKPTEAIVWRIQNRIATAKRLREAQEAYNQANILLNQAVGFWEEMEERAVPDGNGHFYLLSINECLPIELVIRHTSEMAVPEDPSSTDE